MKKMLVLFVLLIMPISVSFAHSGRTDRKGCHVCKTNCKKRGLKTGQYHCHKAK